MEDKKTQYINYIKGKYPEIEMKDIQANLTDGLHNDVIIINDSVVFRFAKHDFSKGLLNNEYKVLQIVKQFVGMPVPNLDILDDGISKYSYIKGNPIYRNRILKRSEDLQEQLAQQLGVFLSQLHSIPMDIIKENNISAFPGNGTRDSYKDLYSRIETNLFPRMKSYVIDCIQNIFSPIFDNKNFLDYRPALIHGDLAPYHIIEESNRVIGIIDFGVSGYGDPAHDISVVLDTLGEGFIKKIGRYYDNDNIESFIDRSRFYANVSSLRWALAGYESNDVSWYLNYFFTAKDISPYGERLD
ncbi:aminoglycoside 2''-phosphotransferase [Paenibacillus forsythiae]|uniref:Aminoglycoside 2''-phosphotransferase n=1 Tax=Paenibacillus forsythiae TaxID=365616 RepID=A0ABU3HE78_9BACL|nr:aminoglycoside phosphotransferase family protein [Paenibacillus forsythiae]MDT3429124.1 aminoglycoside 2''-phosphotransferase [Paenibacillus forsythiae]